VSKGYEGRDKNAAGAMETWTDLKGGQASVRDALADGSQRQKAEQLAASMVAVTARNDGGMAATTDGTQLTLGVFTL